MISPVISDSGSSNSYIVGGRTYAIIDAGFDPSKVLEKINKIHTTQYMFINTHCHYDHVGFLRDHQKVEIAMQTLDAQAIENADSERILYDLFENGLKPVKISRKLEDNDRIDLGGLLLEVIHTPGHTPGSMCLYEPDSKSLFSGDTVFKDGVGRTDFAGGSVDDLRQSVEKLVRLHEKRGVKTLYPGHGPTGSGDDIIGVYEMFF